VSHDEPHARVPLRQALQVADVVGVRDTAGLAQLQDDAEAVAIRHLELMLGEKIGDPALFWVSGRRIEPVGLQAEEAVLDDLPLDILGRHCGLDEQECPRLRILPALRDRELVDRFEIDILKGKAERIGGTKALFRWIRGCALVFWRGLVYASG